MAGRTFGSLKKEIQGKEARQNYSLQQWDELLTQVRESHELSEMERLTLESAITGAIEDRKDPLFTAQEEEEPEDGEWASDWLMRTKGISIAEFSKMGIDKQRGLQAEFEQYEKSKSKPKKKGKAKVEEPEYYEPKEEPAKTKRGKCIPTTKVKEVRNNGKWLDTKFYDNGLVHIEEYKYRGCYYQVMRKGRMPKFKDEIIYVEEM
jgi:hypothetical protein